MSPPARVTNEEIISAYRDTGSVWKAAKRLGLCGQSVHERLQRLGHPMTMKKWTDEERAEISALALAGLTISRIAQQMGRTYAGVACQLSEMKVKHPYRPATKPKRKEGINKHIANEVIDKALKEHIPITRASRMMGLKTTALVNAVQFYAPDKWEAYVAIYGLKELITCPGCSRQFIPLSKKQKYCTGKCGMAARSDVEYFGGNRLNTIGLKDKTCQLCMKTNIEKGLAAHHVVGKQRDPDNQYLIALCAGCHNLVELTAARKGVLDTEFWENLIILAIMRSGACDSSKAFGLRVFVEVENAFDEEDGLPERVEVQVMEAS